MVEYSAFIDKIQGQQSQTKPAAAQPFRLMTVAEIALLPDPEWLIDGILPQGGLVMLYGPPGSKKSFIALDWASSVDTGLPWNGCKVKQGDVVYIYAEGVSSLKRRNHAWQMARKRTPERLLFQPEAINISDPNIVRKFIKKIQEMGYSPKLINIDTLARNFGGGDENTVKDMNAFVAGCATMQGAFPGCTILVVHHTGKDPKKGSRGSSGFKGAADTEIEVHGDPKSLTGFIECKKQKDAEVFGTINYKLTPVGKSAVLDWTKRPVDNLAEVLALKRGGMSVREIALKMNLSKSAVDRLLQTASRSAEIVVPESVPAENLLGTALSRKKSPNFNTVAALSQKPPIGVGTRDSLKAGDVLDVLDLTWAELESSPSRLTH